MNMQVLLEKSSIFTEVLKDQMDRTLQKHAAVAAVTTRKRSKKAKQNERVRRGSGRGKRMRLDSDDEDHSEEEVEEAIDVPPFMRKFD